MLPPDPRPERDDGAPRPRGGRGRGEARRSHARRGVGHRLPRRRSPVRARAARRSARPRPDRSALLRRGGRASSPRPHRAKDDPPRGPHAADPGRGPVAPAVTLSGSAADAVPAGAKRPPRGGPRRRGHVGAGPADDASDGRALRHRRGAGHRRPGPRRPRHGPHHRPGGRAEDPQRGGGDGARRGRPLHDRGVRHGPARAPQHRPRVRDRLVPERAALLHDAGRQAAQPARRAGQQDPARRVAPGAARRRLRPGVAGARLRPPARRPAPRHQAREHPARRLRRGVPGRLGQRQGDARLARLRRGTRPSRCPLAPTARHASLGCTRQRTLNGRAERPLGDARLHRAGADPRRPGAHRPPRRHHRAGGDALRDADRAAPLRRAHGARRHPGHPDARPQAAAARCRRAARSSSKTSAWPCSPRSRSTARSRRTA